MKFINLNENLNEDIYLDIEDMDKINEDEYEKVFTSGHRIEIKPTAGGQYRLDLYTPEGKKGGLIEDTPQDALDKFLSFVNEGTIRKDLIKGFKI